MVKVNFNTGMPTSSSHRGFKLQYSIASKCELQLYIDTQMHIIFTVAFYNQTSYLPLYFYILACNRTYDTDNGRLLNPSYPYYAYANTYCDFAIHVPNPQSRISVYFKYFLLGNRGGNCTNDAYFKVGQNV